MHEKPDRGRKARAASAPLLPRHELTRDCPWAPWLGKSGHYAKSRQCRPMRTIGRVGRMVNPARARTARTGTIWRLTHIACQLPEWTGFSRRQMPWLRVSMASNDDANRQHRKPRREFASSRNALRSASDRVQRDYAGNDMTVHISYAQLPHNRTMTAQPRPFSRSHFAAGRSSAARQDTAHTPTLSP